MSTKLSLRSIALGAVLALSATGLVVAPASAVDTTGPVTLGPSQGSTLNSILQSGIVLETKIDSGLPSGQ